jgi:hypothetical protein
MRDDAQQIAQQAIAQATDALKQGASAGQPATDAASQAGPAKIPSIQTVSLAPSSTKAGPAYLYPNPSLTPGAVLTTDASTICAPGYASGVRDVSTATKERVYAEYAVSYPQPLGAYMKWIILSHSKLAARTIFRTCGRSQRHPRPASIKKTSLRTSSTGRCAAARSAWRRRGAAWCLTGTCTGKRMSRALQRLLRRQCNPRHRCRRPPRR